MQRILFTLIGDSAILQSNGTAMAKLRAPEGWNTRKDGAWIPAPEVEAEAQSYRLPDGQLGMPAAAVFKAILTAAASYPAVNAQGKQLRKSSVPFVAASLHPEMELFPLFDGDDEPIRTYTLDSRRARPQRTGGSVTRARPRIDTPWQIECSFGWLPQVAEDFMRNLIADAGMVVGIGNYRPELKGWYGKFHLGVLVIEGD